MPFLPEQTAVSLFASFGEQAARTPEAPALAWDGGELSYGQLHRRALGAAARLDELGLPDRGPLAVAGPKSADTIVLVLACLLTGRPALLPAPELRTDALRDLLARAGTHALVAAEPFDGALVVEPSAAAAAEACSVSPGDTALILTTSGSTGPPKAVPLTHGAIERFASWGAARFEIQQGTSVLSYCGLNFDLSLLEIWTTLMHGGRAVLVEGRRATHGDHLFELIARHEVQVVQGVPMLYVLLLDASRGRCLPGVRHAILTGDTTPLTTLERLPGLLENARLYNVYGCTETNDSFIHEIDVERALELGAIPLGSPLPGVGAAVVHDGIAVAGPGRGELWVSTPFQTAGYLRSSASDGRLVRTSVGGLPQVWFRSGDLVRRDAAGAIFLTGRNDFDVKLRGVRVNLQEVERALLEHPDVTEAAVVALDDERAGKRAHAVVRRRDGSAVNALGLRAHCAGRLTRIAIPSSIEIQDEPLPRTSTGKVDRGAVEDRATKAGDHG